MDELAYLMDWDLQAIVRGCTSEAPPIIMDNPNLNFSHLSFEQDHLLRNFHEFSETTTVLDELEEIYKPFYPVLHPLSAETIVTSSMPIPEETEEVKALKASEDKVAVQDLQDPAVVSKCKRSKKNQNKRVVKQVTAADGVCDTWAWRKYGQKPIKGSPYPRSYYRCSSSKGCLARKQVERSHLDPGVVIVTYTSEHSHPHPTRRNSLAGSTRNRKKISSVASPSTLHHHDQRNFNFSPNSTAVLVSPRTPLVVQSIEDELVPSVERSKSLKKEEDFVELLEDGEGDDWFAILQASCLTNNLH